MIILQCCSLSACVCVCVLQKPVTQLKPATQPSYIHFLEHFLFTKTATQPSNIHFWNISHSPKLEPNIHKLNFRTFVIHQNHWHATQFSHSSLIRQNHDKTDKYLYSYPVFKFRYILSSRSTIGVDPFVSL